MFWSLPRHSINNKEIQIFLKNSVRIFTNIFISKLANLPLFCFPKLSNFASSTFLLPSFLKLYLPVDAKTFHFP